MWTCIHCGEAGTPGKHKCESYEKFKGHVYSVCRAPLYEKEDVWKTHAEVICLLHNFIQSILAERKRHVKALETISKELVRIEYRGEDNARYETSPSAKIAKQALAGG